MTAQEARKFLEIIATNLLGDSVSENDEKLRKLMLKEYDAIDIAINALEKQIPKKPKEYEDKYYGCPECCNPLMMKWEKYPTKLMPRMYGLSFCLNCGQKIDWGE